MYDPADAEWGASGPRPLARWTKRRPTKRAIILLVCVPIGCVYGMRMWNERSAKAKALRKEREKAKEFEEKPKPPLFEKWHQVELALPQHHVTDQFANGKKYLWVENHVHGKSSPVAIPHHCRSFVR